MSQPKVVIEEIDDPEITAKLKAQDEKFRRNLAVYDAHLKELSTNRRVKVIVVAGEKLYIADTPDAAWAWAEAKHPEDEGACVHCIPRERGLRIYAYRRYQ